MLLGERQLLRQEVGEDQDRGRDTRAPQLGALLDSDDGQCVRPGLERGAGDGHRAVTVGVGLHHGHQVCSPRPAPEGADVVAHGAQLYLGPGAARGSNVRGRATHGRYWRGFRTWRVRMSMRVTTPRSLPSPATGKSFILSSAMVVAASESESSGETVLTSLVMTSSTVTPALFRVSWRYSFQSPRGMMPPRMSRKPGDFMSASWKMRSPSVTIPTSHQSSTTGAPEMLDSAKSLMASSTVCSGLRVGQFSSIMSPTLNSRMSCWFTPKSPDPRSSPGTTYCKRACPHVCRLRFRLPAHGFYPGGSTPIEVEIDEHAAQDHRTPGRHR